MARKRTDPKVGEVLSMYGVKSEEELSKSLIEEWDKVYCSRCGKSLSLLKAAWRGDKPYHKDCL